MIYSPAFDGLPAEVKGAVYRRMWQVLSGQERGAKYARLTPGGSPGSGGDPAGYQEGPAGLFCRAPRAAAVKEVSIG